MVESKLTTYASKLYPFSLICQISSQSNIFDNLLKSFKFPEIEINDLFNLFINYRSIFEIS